MRAPSWTAQALINQNEGMLSTFSTQADYAAIDACLRVAMAPESLLSPSIERESLARACLGMMADILGASPQNAYAWFVQAYFSKILGHEAGMNAALELSYLMGPNEQWIAEQRVLLAENVFSELSETAMRGHKQDLALLVQSQRGIRAIVQRYINDPRFRARITDIVEGLPRDDQRRFLSTLQQEMRGH
ncbi:MAG: hypothetical protein COB08_010830 [Rhodobacteraceae bacterium]|nr:hypothetical protein [Paracoccaceae bacterium]